MTVKVKICGITNLKDAQTAVTAGADYLGFIFYAPSKRAITPPAAQHLITNLQTMPIFATDKRPILVGVFVNESAINMAQILDSCCLDLAQLSGEELPSLVGETTSPIYGRCYKALRPTSLDEAQADAEWFLPPQPIPHHPTLLIDTYHPTLRGGTGETGDWQLSQQLAQAIPGLMLAGGLTAANVAEAVRQVTPFAVDVASGVEAAPGQKDSQQVQTFIKNAKTAV